MTDKKQDKQAPRKGAVELTEEALDRVAGGRKAGEGQKDFLPITSTERSG